MSHLCPHPHTYLDVICLIQVDYIRELSTTVHFQCATCALLGRFVVKVEIPLYNFAQDNDSKYAH